MLVDLKVGKSTSLRLRLLSVLMLVSRVRTRGLLTSTMSLSCIEFSVDFHGCPSQLCVKHLFSKIYLNEFKRLFAASRILVFFTDLSPYRLK